MFFWDGFLEHFKYALKWQRCNEDVRSTYYNNCKLTHIVHEVLSSYLFHSFISLESADLRDGFTQQKDGSLSNFVYYTTNQFTDWLGDLENGDDDWLKYCAMFLRMSKDLFTFIDSFRCGDAIGIETGYELFVVVWRALGVSTCTRCAIGRTKGKCTESSLSISWKSYVGVALLTLIAGLLAKT